MKNLFNTFFFLVFGLVLVGGVGCEGCKEPDPCEEEDVHPVTADFTIMESIEYTSAAIEGYFLTFDTDTIYYNSAEFTALEEDAQYTWIIGAETLHEQSVVRYHFPRGVPIPITLIVEKEPNLMCFPEDDGIDTLTRYLFVADTSYRQNLFGNYLGFIEGNPQDTFTISILRYYTPFGNFIYKAINLKRGVECSIPIDFVGYKQLIFYGGQDICDSPKGRLTISDDDNDKVTIEYILTPWEEEQKIFIFRGRRK